MPKNPSAVEDTGEVPEGIMGRAIDFVKVDAEFAEIAKNLLKNILIVKDLKTAVAIRASGNKSFFL